MKTLVAATVLALIAVGVGVDLWGPWRPESHEDERVWIRSFVTWVDYASSRHLPQGPACRASFDREVGAAPTERVKSAARIARGACGTGYSERDWVSVKWRVWSDLVDSRFAAADTTEEPQLASALRPFAQRAVRVHCWPEDAWEGYNVESQIFDPDDLWIAGFADPPRHAAHLSPDVCEPLRLFFGTPYSPHTNVAALDLSYALTVLVHEGEHLHYPDANEATVECFAVQDVRQLVGNAGRAESYANALALTAWDLTYPHMPDAYRTRRCRNGGQLDLHPESRVWP